MSQTDAPQPHATATTVPMGRTTDVTIDTSDFFIFVLDDDAIQVPETQGLYEELVTEAAFVRHLFLARSKAIEAYEKAIEAYSQALHSNRLCNGAACYLDMAARQLGGARQTLFEAQLNIEREIAYTTEAPEAPADAAAEQKTASKPLSKLSSSGKDLKEVLIATKHGGTRHTRVRSKKLKNHWRTYPLKTKDDLKSADKSFIKNGKMDWDKFKDIAKAKNLGSKLKSKLPWAPQWLEACQNDYVRQRLAAEYTLTPDSEKNGAEIKFGAEAQFIRAATTLEIGAEADLRKGKLSVKVDGGVSLALAECSTTVSLLFPRNGITMAYEDVNLGLLRFAVTLTGSAGFGAAAAAGLCLDIDASKGKIAKRPTTIDSLKSTEPGQVTDMSKNRLSGSKLGASAGAYIGFTLDASMAGALEWKSPEDNHDGKPLEFKALATVKPGLSALAGGGAQLDCYIEFRDGKFRIFAKAALCWGLGCKGSIGFEVDVNQVGNFIICAYHQISSSAHRAEIALISAEAILALSQLSLYALSQGAMGAAKAVYGTLSDWYDQTLAAWEEESLRIQAMENIFENDELVKFMPPLAKGHLIGMLMDSAWWASLRPSNSITEWKDLRLGSNPRKRAIILIFTWVQSKAEFRKIMTHIKTKIDAPDIAWEEGFAQVKRFLDSQEWASWLAPLLVSDYEGNLQRFYDRLHESHPVGYPVIKNNMSEYLTRNEVAPQFRYPYPQQDDRFKATLLAQQQRHQDDRYA